MRKMNFYKRIFSVIFLILLWGCDPQDGKLTLINNSKDTIYYSLSYGKDSIIDYPIIQYNGEDNYGESAIILPLDSHMCTTMDTWELVINECQDSTLRIFFFSKDLIKTVSKDSIMKYQRYSQKFKLKVKDLKKINWRVAYDEK